ncbi:pentatricopeptide repeat-containing protein At1g11900-like [Arachis stenosperma]|uniref:pentatricopeptide repeat-containing protein At1g11900-like n=1 Tax=Arachis stenosperma TaxID=217475 RepID=UPI0025AB9517|nr:pentatricopeptide repeat-containing protein At1g11900-like [Arachis stenosperma]
MDFTVAGRTTGAATASNPPPPFVLCRLSPIIQQGVAFHFSSGQSETLLTAKNQLPLAAVPPVTAACEFRCGGFGGGLRIISALARRSAFATVVKSTKVANVLCLPFTVASSSTLLATTSSFVAFFLAAAPPTTAASVNQQRSFGVGTRSNRSSSSTFLFATAPSSEPLLAVSSPSPLPRVVPSASSLSNAIAFFSTAASPDKEIAAEKVLKEFHATIENAAASSVKEASQKNDIDVSCQAFKKLLLSCKSPTAASCLSFAQAFTKANGCIELPRFIKEVSEITCSSTSFVNKIIFALAKSGQKDKALVIFDYLKSRNYSLDLVTYNIVLDILGRTGRVDEMFDVFATMKEAGFVPDTVSYNTVLNGLRKAGRTDMCIVYFKEMSENGIEPDLLTYTALIENFGRSGNAEESLKCFSEMKLKGILPSIYIYRSLINNLNKSGKVELAKELLEEMNSSSTRLAGPEDFKHKRRRRNRLTKGPEVH